jgi:pimeloyl-ACP methyl ester carboxylesterase
MKNSPIKSTHKGHRPTPSSTVAYSLSKLAFHIAPKFVTRLMREKGFAIKPFELTDKQRDLQSQAHRYFLEFDGHKIRVFEWGSGPVILLVHGWGGRALQLDALVPQLIAKGFKVVAFDHKGHGESSTRFSSYLEIVRSTRLLVEHHAKDLYGVVAHSIGAKSAFKVSEDFERKLKLTIVAPMGDFPLWLEKLRRRIGVYEQLMNSVIRQIEEDTGLNFLEQCELDYSKISRHDIFLVHDKFDRINKISASHVIQENIPAATLMQTEMLGHSRILRNSEVIEKIVAHFPLPSK